MELIGQTFKILSDGFVRVVDVMGDDSSVVQAARVSYGAGTKSVSDDRSLIRYLMRNRHDTPFEMASIKWHIRLPIDINRQWVRHRTASINEYSTRYSEAIDSCEIAYEWRLQSDVNKQGSKSGELKWPENTEGLHVLGILNEHIKDNFTPKSYLTEREAQLQNLARQVYEERLRFGIAKEQARKDLPMATYTEMYWMCNLRNLLHFLKLRMDSHAQLEIREYANTMASIVKQLFPITYEAFEDYNLNSVSISKLDGAILTEIYRHRPDRAKQLAIGFGWLGPEGEKIRSRERDEFEKKLEMLGVLNYEW